MSTLFDLLDTFRKGSARRSAVRILGGFPASQLRDIGIAPDQIGDVVEAMIESGWDRPATLRKSPKPGSLRLGARTAVAGCD